MCAISVRLLLMVRTAHGAAHRHHPFTFVSKMLPQIRESLNDEKRSLT